MLDRQKSNPNAAMMFSGSNALSVNDVVHAIFERALKNVRMRFACRLAEASWLARLTAGPAWHNDCCLASGGAGKINNAQSK